MCNVDFISSLFIGLEQDCDTQYKFKSLIQIMPKKQNDV